MAIRASDSSRGKSNLYTLFRILGLTILVFVLIAAGNIACKKEAEAPKAAQEEEGIAIKEGVIEFDGTVKMAVGKYAFVPEAKGFDIVIQGNLESGDSSSLIGKEIRGKGEFSPERPSILIANSIEMKNEAGTWQPVFTRSEDVVLEDYLDLKARDAFPVLDKVSYDKKDAWEGKGKVKIYGKLETGENAKTIAVFDEKGKLAGKIIIDSVTDFGQYYMNKLRLFDQFWFYIAVKDTFDWKIRRKTLEMFHADVLFAGLF